jgi:TatD-related deoxyribonuclease
MLKAEALYAPTAYQEPWKKGPFSNFTDNHIHIDPIKGEGLEAVKKFERAGGKFLFLVGKTTRDWDLKPGEEGLQKLFDLTIDLSKKINEETGVRSFPVIGIHPAEFVSMCGEFSLEEALELGKRAMERAGERIQEGEAVALGEIGRPHFQVEERILKACNELLTYSLQMASDIDCAVQLHTGSITEKHFEEFRELAVSVGLDPKRVVKHYSPPLIRAAEEAGIFPSLIASQENIKKAVEEGNRFLMESDYIDDPDRPGAVVGPKSVPKVSLHLFDEGVLREEDLWKIHKDNVEEVYGISLDT